MISFTCSILYVIYNQCQSDWHSLHIFFLLDSVHCCPQASRTAYHYRHHCISHLHILPPLPKLSLEQRHFQSYQGISHLITCSLNAWAFREALASSHRSQRSWYYPKYHIRGTEHAFLHSTLAACDQVDSHWIETGDLTKLGLAQASGALSTFDFPLGGDCADGRESSKRQLAIEGRRQ